MHSMAGLSQPNRHHACGASGKPRNHWRWEEDPHRPGERPLSEQDNRHQQGCARLLMPDFQSALPVEEINLRYVAITRAETTCTSGQWPAPMFSALADYIRCHPRFLTQEGAAEAQRSAPRAAQPAAPAAQASPASTALPFAPVVDVTAVVSAYECGSPCCVGTSLPRAGRGARWMRKLCSPFPR